MLGIQAAWGRRFRRPPGPDAARAFSEEGKEEWALLPFLPEPVTPDERNRKPQHASYMEPIRRFNSEQLAIINRAVEAAEDLVSNHYKMSASQWLHRRYDIKTAAELSPNEIVYGPYAQIIRYEGSRKDRKLGSTTYDLYKICLQDHAILDTLGSLQTLQLFPFVLYIVVHELIHIVRFSNFIQFFDATTEERMAEEKRVHAITHQMLENVSVSGMDAVLAFYSEWRIPYDGVKDR
jgi:hypothetical protein